ncbi:hypothetical protein ACFQ2K_44120 [Streptomyces sanglieri]|uniref:Uncharacterized protein n=1 Tax=Streptomyces sanglieri TaxID=193460 RepID=A0ABW2X9Q6_9ACTN
MKFTPAASNYHPNLARTRLAHLDLGDFENLRTAVLAHHYCLRRHFASGLEDAMSCSITRRCERNSTDNAGYVEYRITAFAKGLQRGPDSDPPSAAHHSGACCTSTARHVTESLLHVLEAESRSAAATASIRFTLVTPAARRVPR